MNHPLRVIDTGVQDARLNIAFDQALIDLHEAGEVPATLRFLRFEPSVLLGRHQAVHREIDIEFCNVHGIGVARRITGGGALYFDQGQIGWELVASRRDLNVSDLSSLTQNLCDAAANGLNALGVPVRFRPRNDLEVNGRKIGGTGGFYVGDTVFFQGTVLHDVNIDVMFSALRVPVTKCARHAHVAGARVIGLRELLGDHTPTLEQVMAALTTGLAQGLGFEPYADSPGALEWRVARALHDEEIGRDEFVYGVDESYSEDSRHVATHVAAGGAITASVRVGLGRDPRLTAVLLSGDFFVTPPRVIFDLEAALKDVRVTAVAAVVGEFFTRTQPDFLSVRPEEISAAICAAVAASPGTESP